MIKVLSPLEKTKIKRFQVGTFTYAQINEDTWMTFVDHVWVGNLFFPGGFFSFITTEKLCKLYPEQFSSADESSGDN